MPAKRIYRNTRTKVVGGVCAGIADYFDVDVAWIRLAFVLSVFASGFGLLAYAVAWIVFPRDDRVTGDVKETKVEPPVEKALAASKPVRKRSLGSGSRNAVGILLVLLGVLFFMDQNFWWFRFDAYWPVILIGLGLFMLLRPSGTVETPSASVDPGLATGSTTVTGDSSGDPTSSGQN
jgi:phage shock protein PspC (stress-responsive transcriptional regulator)